MEIKEWSMQEEFIFPEGVGLPATMDKLVVTPRFTEERTEDGVRLSGIYHIAADISFDVGERADGDHAAAVLIDDVDVEGTAGYFEYAVPLHIDLPSEAISPLQVVTTSTSSAPDGQGSLKILWNVACSYEQTALVEDEIDEVVLAVDLNEIPKSQFVAEKVAPAATATNDSTSFTETDEVLSFIAELEDDISTTLFHSNDIFVKNES